MPENTNKCTNLSVRISIKRNANQKIEFTLAKTCNEDAKPTYLIHFALLEKSGDKFEEKIGVDVDVNKQAPGKEAKADETVNAGISDRQVLYVRGPVARAADDVVTPGQDAVNGFDFALLDEVNLAVEDESVLKFVDNLDQIAADNNKKLEKLKNRLVTVLDVH